jgi:hypothetical protein
MGLKVEKLRRFALLVWRQEETGKIIPYFIKVVYNK